LRGTPTIDRYEVATVFIDHYSGVGYIHLQRTTSAEDTIEGKQLFEAWANTQHVTISHYHADNGIFADNKFRKSVANNNQRLTFAGVNAHFQNGMAEKRIRDLQETARTMLIHANKRWSTAINAHLWPYAVRYANDMFNEAPMLKHKDSTPSELFSGSSVRFNVRHAHTFGCPAYVLDDALQVGHRIHKWAERSRVGIFLGHSPQHARTVGLILSLSTGLTSPQFHVQYDDGFATMRASFGNLPPISNWQKQTHFTADAEKMKNKRENKGKTQKKRKANDDNIQGPNHRFKGSLEQQLPPPIDLFPTEPSNNPTEAPPFELPPILPEPIARPVVHTRSGRTSKPTQRYQESLEQRDMIIELAVGLSDDERNNSTIISNISTTDPDVMYWHQAMKQPDKKEFITAAQAYEK
jgi:hypothetical protein